jgi:hypothetical protein
MYLNNNETSYDNEIVTMQLPGGEDDFDDADEEEGWDEIEDEDFEDGLNDRNDLYETELDENILDEDDDDHLPEDDGF